MSLDPIDVVRGRSIVRLPASQLRERAAAAARIVVDLGAGDGRLTYRLARAHPDWLCVAVDACAAAMRRLSSRAARRMARGGAPNALFLVASAESLPDAREAMADEITVQYPWGGLLRAVIEPDPAILRQIARIGASRRQTAGAVERVGGPPGSRRRRHMDEPAAVLAIDGTIG